MPVMVCELALVGLVTESIVGLGGGAVSRIIVEDIEADHVPSEFLNLT